VKDEIRIWFDELKRGDKFIIAVVEDAICFNGDAALSTLLVAATLLAFVSYLQCQEAIRNKSSSRSFLSESIGAQDPLKASPHL